MSDVTTNDSYVPGVCNINHEEIRRRRLIGYVGLAVSVVLLALMLFLPIPRVVRLILFFPAFLSASGFLQAGSKFCSGYGSRGLQNAAEGSLKPALVTDEKALAMDRKKSAQINLRAAVIGLLVAIVAVAI